jgi:type III secretory pathway component EscS
MPTRHQAGVDIEPDRRTFLGIDWRTIIVLIGAGLAAFAIFILLSGWPIFLRAALAVFVVGLGLALAVGRIQGQTFEEWLWDVVRFRRAPTAWLKSAQRLGLAGKVDWAEETRAPAADHSNSNFTARRTPSFFWLSANAIGAAAITGLTIWLAQGGAHQLELVFGDF